MGCYGDGMEVDHCSALKFHDSSLGALHILIFSTVDNYLTSKQRPSQGSPSRCCRPKILEPVFRSGEKVTDTALFLCLFGKFGEWSSSSLDLTLATPVVGLSWVHRSTVILIFLGDYWVQMRRNCLHCSNHDSLSYSICLRTQCKRSATRSAEGDGCVIGC